MSKIELLNANSEALTEILNIINENIVEYSDDEILAMIKREVNDKQSLSDLTKAKTTQIDEYRYNYNELIELLLKNGYIMKKSELKKIIKLVISLKF